MLDMWRIFHLHKQPKPIVEADTAKVVYSFRFATLVGTVMGEPHALYLSSERCEPRRNFGLMLTDV
jgi:hypothetical protein